MSRRLDALFAERVLGCTPVVGKCGCEDHRHAENRHGDWDAFLPEYCTDLSAAWAGVEKLAGDKLASVDFTECGDGWSCLLGWGTVTTRGSSQMAASPALAVVLAALRAAGVPEEEIQKAQP